MPQEFPTSMDITRQLYAPSAASVQTADCVPATKVHIATSPLFTAVRGVLNGKPKPNTDMG